MESATIVGSIAAVASTLSFTPPQAWKIIKSRRTEDISAGMCTLTVMGFALWIAYGFLLDQWPIIVPNTLCLILAAFILTMKVLPRAKRNKVADALDPEAHP